VARTLKRVNTEEHQHGAPAKGDGHGRRPFCFWARACTMGLSSVVTTFDDALDMNIRRRVRTAERR
jgi:hypothetical protein